MTEIQHRTSGIDSDIQLYDSDIQAIMHGPMEWFNQRTGSWRMVDDVHKGLVEQFEKIGFRTEVSVWTLGECKCAFSSHSAESCPRLVAIPDAYQFGVLVTGRVVEESGFDFDRMVHEVQNNLLNIPGEGGVIKFDEADFRRQMGERKHGHG